MVLENTESEEVVREDVEELTLESSDAQIARVLGISRQAVGLRRKRGWSQQQIIDNQRPETRKRYKTPIAAALGMSVKDFAAKENVTPSEIYRRYNSGMYKNYYTGRVQKTPENRRKRK